jgi:4-carboxymuconolactone decarboxylase
VHGQDPPTPTTAFRRGAYLDYLYGEIWTREEHLTRRDRRIISICCCAAVGVEGETKAHLEAALTNGELTTEELQELVVHFAVYVGWALGRQLDDLLLEVGRQS